MVFGEIFFSILEIAGTVSFAISGAMAALEKKVDLFGVIVLGITTALAGGIFRDMLVGRVPPAAFSDGTYMKIAFVTSVIVFLAAEICEVSLLVSFIREKDLVTSCVIGLALIGTCILEILIFITICPELKQDVYSDCQVEQKVIETKETGGWLLANNISTDANFEDFREATKE